MTDEEHVADVMAQLDHVTAALTQLQNDIASNNHGEAQ
ncbi:hypothetical protein O982_23980 [Mycobacterium avium 10-5581]|nr:hypothetical protein O982_23980 [Mycobacterium avium 10-5581]